MHLALSRTLLAEFCLAFKMNICYNIFQRNISEFTRSTFRVLFSTDTTFIRLNERKLYIFYIFSLKTVKIYCVSVDNYYKDREV